MRWHPAEIVDRRGRAKWPISGQNAYVIGRFQRRPMCSSGDACRASGPATRPARTHPSCDSPGIARNAPRSRSRSPRSDSVRCAGEFARAPSPTPCIARPSNVRDRRSWRSRSRRGWDPPAAGRANTRERTAPVPIRPRWPHMQAPRAPRDQAASMRGNVVRSRLTSVPRIARITRGRAKVSSFGCSSTAR